jgi:hypothetical protein
VGNFWGQRGFARIRKNHKLQMIQVIKMATHILIEKNRFLTLWSLCIWLVDDYPCVYTGNCLFLEDTSHIGLGPHPSWAHFNQITTANIFKYSRALRDWWLEFWCMDLGGHHSAMTPLNYVPLSAWNDLWVIFQKPVRVA